MAATRTHETGTVKPVGYPRRLALRNRKTGEVIYRTKSGRLVTASAVSAPSFHLDPNAKPQYPYYR